jgi:D-glycerate 3-kinase
VVAKWEKARASHDNSMLSTTTLADHRIDDLLRIYENLQRYCEEFVGPWRFDGFVHLNTDDQSNVYE